MLGARWKQTEGHLSFSWITMAVDEISSVPKGAADAEPAVERRDSLTKNEASDSESLQAGVRRAEMLRKGWTRQGLIITFTG